MNLSVFIQQTSTMNWIIERLMVDLSKELIIRGVKVRTGDYCDYNGEDVLLHSRFLTARYTKEAKVNSVFVTHVDDMLKEFEVKMRLKKYESILCTSHYDAAFITALLGPSSRIVGIDLPCRDFAVAPLRISIFSQCYSDQRKNEHWLLEFFKMKSEETRKSVILSFLGLGWEDFVSDIAALGVAYELYSYPTSFQNEYVLYKNRLSQSDLLLYMGFDGGQMSVYDGLQTGIEMLFPNISYHRGLSDHIVLYEDKFDLFEKLGAKIASREILKVDLQSRSIKNYSSRLCQHWESIIYKGPCASEGFKNMDNSAVEVALESGRRMYKPLSYQRLKSFLVRSYQRIE